MHTRLAHPIDNLLLVQLLSFIFTKLGTSFSFQIKDVKTSDILTVYEHRLQSLQTKEDHLQDLLDAKTLALSQADRVISQYRGRCAQVSAEVSMLSYIYLSLVFFAHEPTDILSCVDISMTMISDADCQIGGGETRPLRNETRR